MHNKPDLAALIGSRICHDLISPIGAISNGVELLSLDRSETSPELALISESVANASARIRFFRIAYGAISGDQRIARGEVMAVLSDMTRGGRLALEWQSPSELPRREVKLAFLLLQCLETAMPYGGRIAIQNEGETWQMLGTAPRLKVDAPLWQVLIESMTPAELSASHVHFALVPEELRLQDRQIEAQLGETEIRLTF